MQEICPVEYRRPSYWLMDACRPLKGCLPNLEAGKIASTPLSLLNLIVEVARITSDKVATSPAGH